MPSGTLLGSRRQGRGSNMAVDQRISSPSLERPLTGVLRSTCPDCRAQEVVRLTMSASSASQRAGGRHQLAGVTVIGCGWSARMSVFTRIRQGGWRPPSWLPCQHRINPSPRSSAYRKDPLEARGMIVVAVAAAGPRGRWVSFRCGGRQALPSAPQKARLECAPCSPPLQSACRGDHTSCVTGSANWQTVFGN